jgi:LacI family transcriptional regulator
LCVNDNWAASICAIAKKLGFSIPQELAVIGVDDSPITRESIPAVTSVRISCEQIGYEAAKMVHQLIQGKTLKQRVIKVPVLGIVERYSTVGVKRALATDITRALGYIREQACENIRIEDVAATVHVPLRTFELEFRDVVGHTVGTEIRRVRLNRVKLLLETTRLPLSTVARMVGLNDAAYLSKFFTRLTHLTPAQYRDQHQRKNTASNLNTSKKKSKVTRPEQAKRSPKVCQ